MLTEPERCHAQWCLQDERCVWYCPCCPVAAEEPPPVPAVAYDGTELLRSWETASTPLLWRTTNAREALQVCEAAAEGG